MTTVKFTQAERMILANQYKILQVLNPTQAEEYGRLRKIVEEGYEYDYGDMDATISSETVSAAVGEEVYSILEMFRRLNRSYGQLTDKSGIDTHGLEFVGFDGNNEGRHLSYANFLVNTEGKYEEIKNVGNGTLNSHGPFLASYRRMLEVYEPKKMEFPLTKESIIEITTARIHPSNR